MANDSSSKVSARGGSTLSLKQIIAYGGGDSANNLAFSLAVTFLPLYLTDVALISPTTVGLIFLLMRFVDAFTDVAMGSIIDRTNSRWGKFRPWILFGSVPLVVLAVLNFAMPEGLHGTPMAIVWAAGMYFLMGSVAYTAVNIPYGSLAAAMTDNSAERSRLAVSRTFGASIMQVILALAIAPSLQQFAGKPNELQGALIKTIIPLGVLAIALYLFLFLVARENVERTVERVSVKDSLKVIANNRALQMLALLSIIFLAGMFTQTGLMTYFARDVLGNAGLVGVFIPITAGLILIVGWLIPPLVRKFGKTTLFQVTAAIAAAGALIYFLVPSNMLWLAIVGAVLLGIGNGTVNTLMWNMEADTVEYGEWKTGFRSEGTTYAVFSFVRKMAQALGGALGLWIMGWFGYVGGAEVQSESAVTGIRVAIGLFPAIMMLLAAALVFLYPMKDSQHRQILKELAERGEDKYDAPEYPGQVGL